LRAAGLEVDESIPQIHPSDDRLTPAVRIGDSQRQQRRVSRSSAVIAETLELARSAPGMQGRLRAGTALRWIAHCLVSYKEGDLELADCAAKVHEMEAICRAFTYLLAANSTYVKAYASVCEQACKDCEKECLKHERHIECKACADACAATVDQIQLSLK
jgi:Cys-rich four helix bundle protein (predicted Tat secretion target)